MYAAEWDVRSFSPILFTYNPISNSRTHTESGATGKKKNILPNRLKVESLYLRDEGVKLVFPS